MHVGRGAEGPWAALVDDGSVPVAQVRGILRRGQSARLCQEIIDLVARHPEGLVIDLSALQPAAQVASEALAPLATLLHAFAGRPVAFCGRPSWLRPPRLPVFRDRDEAARFVSLAAVPDQIGIPFDRVPEAASLGRQAVTEACERWDLAASLAGPAQLVMTELVDNALLHAGTDLSLTLTRAEDGLHLAVHDGSPVMPQIRHAPRSAVPLMTTGRGLTLVEAFCTAWGATPLYDGKIVWGELHPAH